MYNYDRTASTNWYDSAEPADTANIKVEVRESLKYLKRYITQAKVLPEVFRKLAEALETPKIGEEASHIEQRIEVMTTLAGKVQEIPKLVDLLEKEVDQLIIKLAKEPRFDRVTVIEMVKSLPGYQKLETLAEEIGTLQDQIDTVDSEGDIDWLLESYLGSEAKIAKRIERVAPGSAEELHVGTIGYSYIRHITDVDWLRESLENARN